jgi:YidC/Oxa1 family membrane protein insertase
MNSIGGIFFLLFVNPTMNALSAIYHFLVYIHIPYPLGFSIVLLTVIIRLILYPLTTSQLKSQKKMQELAPKIKKLNKLHKNDAKRLQAETMQLYKEHGINPAAGCLPLLIQMPFMYGLYVVFQNVINANAAHMISFVNKAMYFPILKIQHAWDTNFFGLTLAQAPSHLLKPLGFLIILIPIVTALLQFVQAKMMVPVVKAEEVVEEEVQREKGELTKEKKKEDDFSTAMQTQMLYISPLLFGYLSFKFAIGLSFYYNTFTIFGIIQQYKVQGGWGGATEWVNKVKNLKSKGKS